MCFPFAQVPSRRGDILETAAVQLLLISVISLLMGSIISINVFTLPVERSSPDPHRLETLWEPATSAIYFLYAPTAILTAIFLDSAASKLTAVRQLGVLSALGFLLLAVAGAGVILLNRTLVFIGVAALTIPFSLLAIVKIELLASWLPNSLGKAVALSTFSFGLGSILAASFYAQLLTVFPVTYTISVVSVLFSILTLILSSLLRISPPSIPTATTPAPASSLTNADADAGFEKLTWRSMLASRKFWLFICVCTSFSAGFPVDPYFFKFGAVYKATEPTVLRWFQAGTAVSVLFNVTAATMCDVLRTKGGPLASGARNVLMVQLSLQLGILLLLGCAAGVMGFTSWAWLASFLRLCHLAGFDFAALLAADMFGSKNVSLVFGTGAALSLGAGDGLATALMVAVDRINGFHGTPGHYTPYYFIGAAWSTLAIIALLSLRKTLPMSPFV